MPGWGEKLNKSVKTVTDVKCYIEGGFDVTRHDKFDHELYKVDKDADFYSKTFVINCGQCDGEYIDLFELQEWFDRNREWINQLKKEKDDQLDCGPASEGRPLLDS